MRAVLFIVAVVAVSPVQKVVELLDGLKGKVSSDLAAEEANMQEYSSWCDEEANGKEDAIRSGKRTVNDLAANIADADASISQLTSEIEELAGRISTADKDLSTATGIRSGENSAFIKVESELTATIDTLSRAAIVLGRGQSFLQSGNKDLSGLTAGLKTIIEASWINTEQKSAVQSLIQSQTQTSTDDEDLSLQPQATAAAFSSQGSGILDILKDMKEQGEASLSGARKAEMEQAHSFAMLKASLETELKTMNKRKAEASLEKSATQEARNSAQEKMDATQKTVDADTAYLADLKQACATKASEWAERQRTAAEEMATIEKAKEILNDGVKSFVQLKSTIKSSGDADKRASLVQTLRELARSNHVYALSQLAQRATTDPFGKVRGLIETMIERLNKEAASEADSKQFCDTENAKSKAKQADLSAKLEKHQVRIEQAKAGMAELAQQTKALMSEIAAMDAAQAEATKIRQDEHAEFTQASADLKSSASACANAMATLQDYYAQGSFVQTSDSDSPDFGGAKTDVASTIVGLLEVAESDFTRMLAEAEASETAGKTSYDKMVQANAVARAASQTEIEGNNSEAKSLETSLLNYKEDHTTTGKELDSVLKYLDKLKPQCETKVMSYAERKARREAEVEGLKQALTILEG